MVEECQPARGCAPPTAAKGRQDRWHHHERELSGGEVAGRDGLNADPSREHRRTPSRGPEGGRARGSQEEQGMPTVREIDPFLKADLPTRAPEASRAKSPPTCTKVPTLWHGGQAPHVIQTDPKKERANAPRLHAPSFLGQPVVRKANSRVRACNRPTVKRPFIFAVTSGQRGEPPRKKRTTSPRLCAPSASLQLAVQHGGLGPHVMQPTHRLPGAKKPHRRLRQCHVFSGPSRKSGKVNFSEPVQRLEAPPRMAQ
jgi:hypothetical protein